MDQAAPKVSTVGEALIGLHAALLTWTEGTACSDDIDQAIRQWFYETTRGWLELGGSRKALSDRVPSLEQLIRDCLRDELYYQTKIIKDAKAERAGKVDESMGRDFVDEVLASEPAVAFLKKWLRPKEGGWPLMTTPTKPTTIDPAALNTVLRFLRFDDAMAGDCGKLPDAIVKALNAATAAYVRSQRDSAVFLGVLEHHLPSILLAVDVAVEETLRNTIEADAEAPKNPKESAEDIAMVIKELPQERAVYEWLFPKAHERKGA